MVKMTNIQPTSTYLGKKKKRTRAPLFIVAWMGTVGPQTHRSAISSYPSQHCPQERREGVTLKLEQFWGLAFCHERVDIASVFHWAHKVLVFGQHIGSLKTKARSCEILPRQEEAKCHRGQSQTPSARAPAFGYVSRVRLGWCQEKLKSLQRTKEFSKAERSPYNLRRSGANVVLKEPCRRSDFSMF